MVGHEPTYFNERQINIKIQGKKGRDTKRTKERKRETNVLRRTYENEPDRIEPIPSSAL